jgi:hypothetical protein
MSMTMNSTDAFQRRHALLRRFAYLSIGLSVVSLLWLVFATIAALDVESWLSRGESAGDLLGLGLLFTFFAHLAMLGMTVVAIRSLAHIRLLGSASLLLCSVSTILLVSDWACFHDIARQYPAGLGISGELSALRVGLAVHYVYLPCQIALAVSLISELKNPQTGQSTRPGENLFNAVHVLGVVCASVGLTITMKMGTLDLPVDAWKWSVVPVIFIVALPYAFVFLSWLYGVRKEADAGLMDEKQKTDLLKAGTTAWLSSFPITVILFLTSYGDAQGAGTVLWLPVYLFASLLIFSAGALYFFRKA